MGSKFPQCGSTDRRLFRTQGSLPAYRCRAYEGYCTLLTGTVFENTRQRPTTRVSRELSVSRKHLHTLRQRIQANLNDAAPTQVTTGTTCGADEPYQHAGEQHFWVGDHADEQTYST